MKRASKQYEKRIKDLKRLLTESRQTISGLKLEIANFQKGHESLNASILQYFTYFQFVAIYIHGLSQCRNHTKKNINHNICFSKIYIYKISY